MAFITAMVGSSWKRPVEVVEHDDAYGRATRDLRRDVRGCDVGHGLRCDVGQRVGRDVGHAIITATTEHERSEGATKGRMAPPML